MTSVQHHSDNEVAFPTLSAKDLAALAARGHPRAVRAGEVLFAEGDRNLPFFVVLDGSVEIVGHSRGTPHTVTVHRHGQFTGDVDMLSGRGVLVTGRAGADPPSGWRRPSVKERWRSASCTRISPGRHRGVARVTNDAIGCAYVTR